MNFQECIISVELRMSASKRLVSDSRRSTAAQFYLEEESVEPEKSTYDKVVELINQASLSQVIPQKVANLKQVQELIIHKEPNLLDNFLDEMLAFQQDKAIDVRKFVVGFIEEACKKDPEIFPQVIANLLMMLVDESVAVVKRVIQSATQLYKVAFGWLCRAKKCDRFNGVNVGLHNGYQESHFGND